MSTTRREFPSHTTAAQVAAGAARIRIGACVVGLDQARQAGLEGVEVSAGEAAERLSIADPKVRAHYKEQMRQTGLSVCSLMMGLFNSQPLASDPRAPAWIEQSIDAAQDLGARVILLAFFGDGDLLDAHGKVKESAVDVAVERIRAAAPRARDAGVVLGIENYLNGEQNARILDRIDHEAAQLYFDVYNTGTTKQHNVPADIRLLQGRIAQFHFKNSDRYLDADKAKFEPIAAAIRETGYQGWIVLETSSPSQNAVADARRNGDYARSLFA